MGGLAFGAREGLINVANARTLTLNSSISGSSGLTICLEDYNGTSASLVLGGANTFTGLTTIEGNIASLKVVLTNGLAFQNSTVDYNNYGASLQFGSGATNVTTATLGGLRGGQSLALTNSGTSGGAVALTVGGNGGSTTYAGVLSGAGSLTKAGSGTLTLTGVNTYTGATIITNGALVVNGSTASGSTLSVNSGGALGGSGTINGSATLNNGSVLAPGLNGVSTLTFAGGLNLKAGSTLNLNLGSASDHVALTNSYTAPSGGVATINVTAVSGFAAGTYNLITGASGISSSSFSLGVTPAGYSYGLSASGGTLSLTVAPQVPAGLVATAGDPQVTLTWSASANATSYNVQRATVSGGPYTSIGTTTNTSYTDTNVTYGTTYYYVVSALTNGIASANSTEISATPVSPYQQFLQANNLAVTTADSATPDGDGVPILLKYATAMTPGTPSAAGPATIGVVGNNLTLQFNRLSPATVNYLVDASSDLVNWTNVASLAAGATTWIGSAAVNETGNNPVVVTVTDNVAMSASGPRFLRLRVTTATDTAILGTVPQGDAPLNIAGAATSANCLTLDNTPVARNTVQAVSGSTVTVVNAGTWATAPTPYALRLLSGNASGATFTITAQSSNTLTLATQGINLTQLLSVGDTYEILPLETLGTLFGTTSVPFQSGSSASAADNIELWNGNGWLVYYPNGSTWKQAGSLLSQNNTVLPSGSGWLTLRRGTTPITDFIVGRVPEVALRQFTTPGGSTFLGGTYPLNTPLVSTGFAASTSWLAGATASVADDLQLWSGTGWLTFYFNGTNWKQSGSLLNQNNYVVSAGQPIFVVRRSSPSTAQALVIQPLPYTP